MRYIFYHYNYNGSLILDYDGEDFRTTQVYVYYRQLSCFAKATNSNVDTSLYNNYFRRKPWLN